MMWKRLFNFGLIDSGIACATYVAASFAFRPNDAQKGLP